MARQQHPLTEFIRWAGEQEMSIGFRVKRRGRPEYWTIRTANREIRLYLGRDRTVSWRITAPSMVATLCTSLSAAERYLLRGELV